MYLIKRASIPLFIVKTINWIPKHIVRAPRFQPWILKSLACPLLVTPVYRELRPRSPGAKHWPAAQAGGRRLWPAVSPRQLLIVGTTCPGNRISGGARPLASSHPQFAIVLDGRANELQLVGQLGPEQLAVWVWPCRLPPRRCPGTTASALALSPARFWHARLGGRLWPQAARSGCLTGQAVAARQHRPGRTLTQSDLPESKQRP